MIEISIPQMGEDSRNLKDMVFTVLSHESSLSTMQIFNKILKTYRTNITYQGVMAHQVPHASIVNDDGYLMVDYSKIDVEFKKVN